MSAQSDCSGGFRLQTCSGAAKYGHRHMAAVLTVSNPSTDSPDPMVYFASVYV